jgi:hypothetical protein
METIFIIFYLILVLIINFKLLGFIFNSIIFNLDNSKYMHYYTLLCIQWWTSRERIGQNKHWTKEQRKNFQKNNSNRRTYSTYVPDITDFVEQIEERRSNNWQHYKIEENYFPYVDDDAIEYVIDQFWGEIMNKLDDDQFVLILFRIIYVKKGWIITLGEAQKVNKKDQEKITELYKHLFEVKDDVYKTTRVDHFTISYNIIPQDQLKSTKTHIRNYREDSKGITWDTFFGTNLPNTADFNLWGRGAKKIFY